MFGGCGSYFKLNETYLVYGYKNIIGTSTNYCTRTNHLKFINKNELDSLKKLQIDLFKTKNNEIEIDIDYLTDYDMFKSLMKIDNLNNKIEELKEKERNYISIIVCVVFVITAMFTYIFIKRK